MKPLPHPNNKFLEAAEGWLGLGNYLEANEELEKIEPKLRAHPAVLEIRYKIYSGANKWEMALGVAEGMIGMLPENSWGYFYSAFALHELKRTEEAYEVVKAVIHKFPDHQIMHYNLACYACQIGKLEDAMVLLEMAIDMKGLDIRTMALEDPDLEPLWEKIGEV